MNIRIKLLLVILIFICSSNVFAVQHKMKFKRKSNLLIQQKKHHKFIHRHHAFMANIYTSIQTNGFGIFYEVIKTHFTSNGEKIFLGTDVNFAESNLILQPSIFGYIDNLFLIFDGFLGAGVVINKPENQQLLGDLTFGVKFLWFLTKFDIEMDSKLNIKNRIVKAGLSFCI